MPDYNKMFQTIATILDHGEYILRQTARKLEHNAKPGKMIAFNEVNSDIVAEQKDFSTRIRNYIDSSLSKNLIMPNVEIMNVTPKKSWRAFEVTVENKDEVIAWLAQHDDVVSVRAYQEYFYFSTKTEQSIDYVDYGNGVIVEEFDGVNFTLYAYTKRNFKSHFNVKE